MEPIIKSKEKCLHCIYGVTGECEMYDDFGLPEDGEKCYNYEEASEEEIAEGQRIAEAFGMTVDIIDTSLADLAPLKKLI